MKLQWLNIFSFSSYTLSLNIIELQCTQHYLYRLHYFRGILRTSAQLGRFVTQKYVLYYRVIDCFVNSYYSCLLTRVYLIRHLCEQPFFHVQKNILKIRRWRGPPTITGATQENYVTRVEHKFYVAFRLQSEFSNDQYTDILI